MSENTKLENKCIVVGEKEYRLTIKREYREVFGLRMVYVAYLSDVESQFASSFVFTDINQLEKGLRPWIIKSDMLNNPESRVFESLKEWDGVIEV